MPNYYSPRNFFRKVPNSLLQQYFAKKNVLADINFSALEETKIEPIYEAWLALSEDIRNEIEQDFQEIDELATEGGVKAILDEANYHGENLAKQFSELDSFHGRAFWTFLEHPQYWPAAVAFNNADNIPISYWRKRKNLLQETANINKDTICELEQAISNYFYTKQGRGNNCKVDCYKRNGLDYFFAYPQDYVQASIEWEGKKIKRCSHNPAFEIIFVYSPKDGTLDIYLSGDRKPVKDLQGIFADTILQTKLSADEKDERIYNLTPLLSRDFQFVYEPESEIADVVVKKLRLKIRGTSERILLEIDPSQDRYAIYNLLDKVTKIIPLSQIALTQVGMKVIFNQNPALRKKNTRTFDISYPNSCSLKQEGSNLIIRKMLADSGIEPKEPVDGK
jgi:hypothetical protein